MSDVAIEVRGLHKRYPRRSGWRTFLHSEEPRSALAGIDLTVRRGEIFGLLGPNGAGKTTLIKILAGLIIPDAGSATVDGHDVVQDGLRARRSIGVVYGDERSFYWRLSVVENLRFYASLYGLKGPAAEDRIDQLLRAVGLDGAREVRMHSFSSGMKQRAAIARGLINNPQVIFMDEPTRSLDPIGAEELHRLITDRVANEGRTVLIATNLMSEAESLCHSLALIDQGSTVLNGTIADFRSRLGAEDFYGLVVAGGQPGWDRGLRAIPCVLDVALYAHDRLLHEITLSLDAASAALPLVIRYLVQHSLDIRSCTRQEQSLDEIFRKLVRQRRSQEASV